jgi:hypothetical protein
MAEEKKAEEAKQETKSKGPALCGHVNKHFIPAKKDNQPVQDATLTCTQDKGHGPVRVVRYDPGGKDISTMEIVHSAPYKTVRGGAVVTALAEWMDEAGTPLSEELTNKHK